MSGLVLRLFLDFCVRAQKWDRVHVGIALPGDLRRGAGRHARLLRAVKVVGVLFEIREFRIPSVKGTTSHRVPRYGSGSVDGYLLGRYALVAC